MQIVPSWDLFLTIFFIVSVGYGFLLQRDRVVVTLLAVYAGIVMANLLGPILQQFFIGDRTLGNQFFIKANASPFTIQSAIFVLTTVLVTVRSGINRNSRTGVLSTFELAIFSFLNSALILTAILSFLDPAAREQFAQTSRIAKTFITKEIWWTLAPLVALIVTGGLGRGRQSSYDY